MSKSRPLLQTLFFVSLLNFFSRLMGVYRELAIAKLLGTGEEASLFIFSEKLPKFLHGIFFDGLCLQAVLPILSCSKRNEKKEDYAELESNFFLLMLSIFSVATLASTCLAPLLIALFGPGWFLAWLQQGPHAQLYQKAISLVQSLMPGLFFVVMASYLGVCLNVRKSYLTTTLLPLIVHLFIIASAYLPCLQNSLSLSPLNLLICAFNLSCFLGLIIQIFQARYQNVSLWPSSVDFQKKGIRKFFKSMTAVLVSAFVLQISSILPVLMSTFLDPKATGQLHYAYRAADFLFYAFRAGLMTLIPAILAKHTQATSRHDPKGDALENRESARKCFAEWLSWSFGLLISFSLPTILWAMFEASGWIKLFYGRTSIAMPDLDTIEQMFRVSACVVFGQSVSKLLATACFAVHELKTPMFATLAGVAVQLFLSIFAIWHSPLFICYAAFFATLAEIICLASSLQKRRLLFGSRAPFKIWAKLALATLLSALATQSFYWIFSYVKGAALGGLWTSGGLLGFFYLLFLFILGVRKTDILKIPCRTQTTESLLKVEARHT